MKRNRPAGAVKNRPLGTQAAPACEGGVLAPVRPVQYSAFGHDRAGLDVHNVNYPLA
jgi:hypothetical protein